MQFRTTHLLAGALALLMMLSFAGCREKPGGTASSAAPEANPSGTAQTEPTETQPPEEVHLPILPLDDSQMADPAARVIDRAPTEGREGLTVDERFPENPLRVSMLYSFCTSSTHLYPNASAATFPFIDASFMPWNMNRLKVNIAAESLYKTEIDEWLPETAPQLDPHAQPDALPYYVYASWRGMDWKELALLELAAREAPADKDAARARDAFWDQYLEDFLALQPEDFPHMLYLYRGEVRFLSDVDGGRTVDEKISTISLNTGNSNIGDAPSSERDVGYSADIILSAEDPRPSQTPGLTLAAPGYEALAAPLNNGDCYAKAMEFYSEEDLTLKGLAIYGSNVRIQTITVLRTRAGETSEAVWDGQSDLLVQSGETVELYLSLHDGGAENSPLVAGPDGNSFRVYDRETAQPGDHIVWVNSTLGEYRKDQFCILNYVVGTDACKATTELVLCRNANPWEMTFLFSCDEDYQFSEHLYSYYLDYYNPLFNPAWQGETP